MVRSNSARIRGQVRFLQRQFLQEGELPFSDILSLETISQALKNAEVAWNNCVYTPLVTLWVFLSQVLSQDHSCRIRQARPVASRAQCRMVWRIVIGGCRTLAHRNPTFPARVSRCLPRGDDRW